MGFSIRFPGLLLKDLRIRAIVTGTTMWYIINANINDMCFINIVSSFQKNFNIISMKTNQKSQHVQHVVGTWCRYFCVIFKNKRTRNTCQKDMIHILNTRLILIIINIKSQIQLCANRSTPTRQARSITQWNSHEYPAIPVGQITYRAHVTMKADKPNIKRTIKLLFFVLN